MLFQLPRRFIELSVELSDVFLLFFQLPAESFKLEDRTVKPVAPEFLPDLAGIFAEFVERLADVDQNLAERQGTDHGECGLQDGPQA